MGQELYTVNPVSFNMRDYDEFSAIPFKEGLVFCSNRMQNVFIARVDSLNRPLLDLYYVRRKDNGHWASPSVFMKEISSRKHEGPFTFTRDGQTIYFTQNEDHVNGIYISTNNGTQWSQPTPFPYNESNADAGHPFLSDDGNRLFFVSNKRGGFGGFDIYVCTWAHNRWGQPKNLGNTINSAADELYPFLSAQGRLYFASNRKDGFGGLDIYFSKEKNGKWSIPKLLPAPVNSKADDFAYVCDSTDRHGYFSSDRSNKIKLCDIFEYTMNFPVMNTVTPQEVNKYTYTFTDQNSTKTDSTALTYEWDFGDNSKLRGKALEVDHTFSKTGDYNIQLNVIDTITGTIFKNQASYTFTVADAEQPYITCADSAAAKTEITFSAEKTYLPDKQITNYFWDFGDESIADGLNVKHSYTEAGVYRVKLSVGYITDKKSPPVYETRYKEITIK